jgi:hypothetical protein
VKRLGECSFVGHHSYKDCTGGKAELYSMLGCICLGIDILSSKLSKKKWFRWKEKRNRARFEGEGMGNSGTRRDSYTKGICSSFTESSPS